MPAAVTAMPAHITAWEHQRIAITSTGSASTLSRAEAAHLEGLARRYPGFCEFGLQSVKLAQYCGAVGLGGRVLEVLPKVQDAQPTHGADATGALLRLLRLSGGASSWSHESASHRVNHGCLLDAFIAHFFDLVRAVIRGGLQKRYREQADDLGVVRGRIAIGRQLGALANRADRIACEYDDLTVDNVLNRTLAAAVRATRPWLREMAANRRWLDLMAVFDEVDDRALTTHDLQRLVFDRQAERYREAITWARWILALLAPSLRAGTNEAPALLFDMNRLFESAVARVLARRVRASGEGLTVIAQEARAHLASIDGADGELRYRLRPDIVVRKHGVPVMVADTKWKRVGVDSRGYLSPDEADVYQMHVYASGYGVADVALVYPWYEGLSGVRETVFRLRGSASSGGLLRVLCVNVEDDRLPVRSGVAPLAFFDDANA